MQTRERILTIKLTEKLSRNPVYAKEIGLEVTKKQVIIKKKGDIGENLFRP